MFFKLKFAYIYITANITQLILFELLVIKQNMCNYTQNIIHCINIVRISNIVQQDWKYNVFLRSINFIALKNYLLSGDAKNK